MSRFIQMFVPQSCVELQLHTKVPVVFAFFLLALIVGCGETPNTVKGTVTYEGVPVPRGVITINPENGRGKGEGAKIQEGAFEVKSIAPGTKVVSVVGFMDAKAESDQPMSKEKAFEDYASSGQGSPEVTEVPRNAGGNNKTIEIKEGEQTIDIKLTKPTKAGRR